MSTFNKMSEYFAEIYAEKATEEVPAGKLAEIRHIETDANSYVTRFKEHGSEYFEPNEVKQMITDLSSGYKSMALIYAETQHSSEWQSQQYKSAIAGYEATNAALKELGGN